jgi:hypothetical protein
MLDLTTIKAITLDLDDTLWPVLPVIERAEKALDDWLGRHAPMTAALFANPVARHEIREHVMRFRPELKCNLSAIRCEAIRVALYRAGENPLLAEPAFDVFFDARNRVTLFEDALLALEFLSSRFPLVAVSNGNADIKRIGIDAHFCASILVWASLIPAFFMRLPALPKCGQTRCCTLGMTPCSMCWARSIAACKPCGSIALITCGCIPRCRMRP